MKRKDNDWQETKKLHYGKHHAVMQGKGRIDFSPESKDEVLNAEGLSYDEYLEIQRNSVESSDYRTYLELCYFDAICADFKATITRKSKGNIMFERLYISGCYEDGVFFEGREQHFWMSEAGLEEYEAGQSVAFIAEIYRYLKTGAGKQINLSLRNPYNIKEIGAYDIPTDEELIAHQYDNLICEVCLFNEHCSRNFCMAASGYHDEMFAYLKDISKGKFTPITVFAAYEKAGMVVTQMVEQKLMKLPKDINHPLSRMVFESWLHPSPCYMDVQESLCRMFRPEKPRIYFE